MKRDGELIVFDSVDISRYPSLPKFVPLEGVPELFDKLTERQLEAIEEKSGAESLDVMDEPEHARQHRLAAAHRRLYDLGVLKSQLGMIAPDEIAASMSLEEAVDLPGFNLTVLDQE